MERFIYSDLKWDFSTFCPFLFSAWYKLYYFIFYWRYNRAYVLASCAPEFHDILEGSKRSGFNISVWSLGVAKRGLKCGRKCHQNGKFSWISLWKTPLVSLLQSFHILPQNWNQIVRGTLQRNINFLLLTFSKVKL